MSPAAWLATLALASAPSAAIETWTLGDGTEVALVEDRRAPVVSIRIVFPSGTWSPWVRRSHVEEAFELQMRDARSALRGRAQALSADVALTMGDRTATLAASFLREDLEAVTTLIRDVLANRDYDRRELIARRRSGALTWGLAQRSPQFRLAREGARRLFDEGDPRRWAWEKPAGVETDGKALATARDALVRLPGRIVGFSGAISRAEADGVARRLLPRAVALAPADLAPSLAPIRPDGGPDGTVRVPRLTQVYFLWLRPSLPWTDANQPAFAIADHVLGGHFYSRLSTALRHEGGETYGASTIDRGDAVPSVYGLATFTKIANAARIEEKLRRVLAEFHEHGITEAERADAASHLLGRRAFARQSPDQILASHLRARALGLSDGWFDALPLRAAALSLDEVNAFIRAWYDPARFTMLKAAP